MNRTETAFLVALVVGVLTVIFFGVRHEMRNMRCLRECELEFVERRYDPPENERAQRFSLIFRCHRHERRLVQYVPESEWNKRVEAE